MAEPTEWNDLSGDELLRLQEGSGLGLRPFHREFIKSAMTYDAFWGRVYRARCGRKKGAAQGAPELFAVKYEDPLELDGDFVIIGDIHAPCTDYDFAQLPQAIARAMRIKNLIIAGDLVNAEWAGIYERIMPQPEWDREVQAARQLFKEWLEWFTAIYVLTGNHDRRVARISGGEVNLRHVIASMTNDERVTVSLRDRCFAQSGGARWLIAHGGNYSINQLTVGDQIASKYGCHVITHHQHHLAIGWNRYKQWVVVDNGALVDENKLAYIAEKTTKSACMAKGFTVLRAGTPYVFGEAPFTNWEDWLK